MFGVAMLMLPFLGFSQLGGSVVYDPTQAVNMSAQIENTRQQISQLDKSLEYMQKAEDKLSTVSGYLRDMEDLKKISHMYQESISLAQKLRGDINKVKSPRMKKYYVTTITDCISSLQGSVSFINKVLSSNFFKMTDKERMDLIEKERHKVFMKRSKLVSLTL